MLVETKAAQMQSVWTRSTRTQLSTRQMNNRLSLACDVRSARAAEEYLGLDVDRHGDCKVRWGQIKVSNGAKSEYRNRQDLIRILFVGQQVAHTLPPSPLFTLF